MAKRRDLAEKDPWSVLSNILVVGSMLKNPTLFKFHGSF